MNPYKTHKRAWSVGNRKEGWGKINSCIPLVNNSENYYGKWVAMRSFTDKDVIASGKDPLEVVLEAEKLDCNDPVIIYVPEKDVIQIY